MYHHQGTWRRQNIQFISNWHGHKKYKFRYATLNFVETYGIVIAKKRYKKGFQAKKVCKDVCWNIDLKEKGVLTSCLSCFRLIYLNNCVCVFVPFCSVPFHSVITWSTGTGYLCLGLTGLPLYEFNFGENYMCKIWVHRREKQPGGCFESR